MLYQEMSEQLTKAWSEPTEKETNDAVWKAVNAHFDERDKILKNGIEILDSMLKLNQEQ